MFANNAQASAAQRGTTPIGFVRAFSRISRRNRLVSGVTSALEAVLARDRTPSLLRFNTCATILHLSMFERIGDAAGATAVISPPFQPSVEPHNVSGEPRRPQGCRLELPPILHALAYSRKIACD